MSDVRKQTSQAELSIEPNTMFTIRQQFGNKPLELETMLDIVGFIVLTVYYTVAVGLVVALANVAPGYKLKIILAASAWLFLVAAVYASGGLKAGLLGPIPVNFVPFTILLGGLFGTWLVLPEIRRAMDSVPLQALIAVHSGRLAGIFFLLLYADSRLSAPFGPVAGVGDMVTGAIALLLSSMIMVGMPVRRWWIATWNAFGAFDLLAAIAIAALSAPGTPFRFFYDGSGTRVLATLPWIFAPALLVPLDLFFHFLIAKRLRSVSGEVRSAHPQRSFSHAS